jgi:protein-tyrosine phosphatase
MDSANFKNKTQFLFTGAPNFRDLGGYQTIDGRFVKKGLLYRSGRLSDLSDTDVEGFRALNIKTVCDLRISTERQMFPNRLPEIDPPRTISLKVPSSEQNIKAGEDIEKGVRDGSASNQEVEDFMLDTYSRFCTDTDFYKQFFEILLDSDNLPLVFLCNAGKDRTGRATMIILLALGVPEETIYKDYLLSIERMAMFNEIIINDVLKSSDHRLYPENVRPMLIVQREYLAASFRAIKDEYGSPDNYLNKILPNHDLDRLREIFLTETN